MKGLIRSDLGGAEKKVKMNDSIMNCLYVKGACFRCRVSLATCMAND